MFNDKESQVVGTEARGERMLYEFEGSINEKQFLVQEVIKTMKAGKIR